MLVECRVGASLDRAALLTIARKLPTFAVGCAIDTGAVLVLEPPSQVFGGV